MAYMVSLGLFEDSDGRITCLKLAKRLDDTNSKNPQIKDIIKKIHSDKLRVSPNNSGQIRLDKNRKEYKNKTLADSINDESNTDW